MKTVDEILEQFEYDSSVEAYESSPMVQLLKSRDDVKFLDNTSN